MAFVLNHGGGSEGGLVEVFTRRDTAGNLRQAGVFRKGRLLFQGWPSLSPRLNRPGAAADAEDHDGTRRCPGKG